MKRQYKKIGYGIGFFALTLFFVACSSEPIVIGETAPAGLFEFLFVYPVSWLLDTFFKLTNNGGLAILLVTVIIIILTLPIEVKSQLGLKQQQEIQPQLKKLQEKYPNSKEDANQQQAYAREYQQLMATNGMSMLGMCLPMLLIFLQMPIIIALSSAVSRLTSLNSASFELFGVTYHYGQADPGLPIPYIGTFLRIFIIASIIAMFLSQYFSLPKDQRDPRKNQQVVSMYLMNIFMALMFWGQPIALAMYWTVSSLGRLIIRLTITNKIVEKEHAKFLAKQRKEKEKRYK
jgi:YidC/Oxa1 family membrane protein insertase